MFRILISGGLTAALIVGALGGSTPALVLAVLAAIWTLLEIATVSRARSVSQ